MPAEVHVVAAVLSDAAGRVLLARRADDAHQGGLWEFPGGKVEPHESAEAALGRELAEELGIRVDAARPFIRVRHDYADRKIDLEVWRVEAWSGEPHGREGQPIDWVERDALPSRRLPAADRPVVAAARLPATYLITPEPGRDAGAFLAGLEASLANGLELVQLRAKRLDRRALERLVRDALDRCRGCGARLLVNSAPEIAAALGADGVHLDSARLAAWNGRPLGEEHWVAASCHDRAQLARAAALGLDFAVLSPVRATPGHPGTSPLGWEGFKPLARDARLPVYALGGLDRADLDDAWRHGAQGVAAIRGLWVAG